MPTYKLTYFDLTGRAELSRLLFSLAGQEFEDIRIQGADWPALKDKTPMGSLPLLDVDGVEINQSIAIARFIARQFGFAGKSDQEAAEIDMVVDCLNEPLGSVATLSKEKDEKKKGEMLKKFNEETFPAGMEKLEKLLGNKDWFVGDSVSWADVALYSQCCVVFPAFKMEVPWAKAPDCKKLADKVAKLPQVVAWRAKHPL